MPVPCSPSAQVAWICRHDDPKLAVRFIHIHEHRRAVVMFREAGMTSDAETAEQEAERLTAIIPAADRADVKLHWSGRPGKFEEA